MSRHIIGISKGNITPRVGYCQRVSGDIEGSYCLINLIPCSCILICQILLYPKLSTQCVEYCHLRSIEMIMSCLIIVLVVAFHFPGSKFDTGEMSIRKIGFYYPHERIVMNYWSNPKCCKELLRFIFVRCAVERLILLYRFLLIIVNGTSRYKPAAFNLLLFILIIVLTHPGKPTLNLYLTLKLTLKTITVTQTYLYPRCFTPNQITDMCLTGKSDKLWGFSAICPGMKIIIEKGGGFLKIIFRIGDYRLD